MRSEHLSLIRKITCFLFVQKVHIFLFENISRKYKNVRFVVGQSNLVGMSPENQWEKHKKLKRSHCNLLSSTKEIYKFFRFHCSDPHLIKLLKAKYNTFFCWIVSFQVIILKAPIWNLVKNSERKNLYMTEFYSKHSEIDSDYNTNI
jgi:hypothetical protein